MKLPFYYLFISLIHVAQTGLKPGKCDLKLLSHHTQVSMVLGMKPSASSVTYKHYQLRYILSSYVLGSVYKHIRSQVQ